MVVLGINEFVPRLAWLSSDEIIIMIVQSEPILVNVSKEVVSSENLRNLHELVIVVASLEEWFLLEDHSSEHAAKRPDIKRVVVGLQIDKKLGSFEVSTCNSNIILLARMVELSQTPVNEAKFAVSMVNHYVMRLDIAVHDTF